MPHHEDKKCQRCNTAFECKAGNIAQCQCSTVQLSVEERAYIESEFDDCLCMACLLEMKAELASQGRDQV